MRAAALSALLFAFPAEAHCYSVWHYPKAQRCDDVAQRQDPPAPPVKPASPDEPLPAFTVNEYNTIILTPKPGRTDEEGRADAIKILKRVLQQ